MVYVRLNEHAKALEDASTAVALSPLWTKGGATLEYPALLTSL